MKALHDWFFENKRDFPWRKDPSPYAVWVSEVMLQQTRASVVEGYFSRWMQQFPDIASLAKAPLEQVIKAWEGLGYYSRARNLHQGAIQVMERFGGELPDTAEQLATIRGLGPYTIGAILSFGFHRRAPAVDGNVMRVLSRYFAIEERMDRLVVQKKLRVLAEELLEEKEPWVTAEALIELGATICVPKPRCLACPLNLDCKAFQQNKAEALPIKKEASKITVLRRTVLVIEACGAILLRQTEAGRVMAGLYELPYFEMGEEKWDSQRALKEAASVLGIEGQKVARLPEVSHTFTRYKAFLFPLHLRAYLPKQIPGYEWVPFDNLSNLPFSSGHKKILAPFYKVAV